MIDAVLYTTQVEVVLRVDKSVTEKDLDPMLHDILGADKRVHTVWVKGVELSREA